MKAFLKALLRLTPYTVVRRTRHNRFDAVDDALMSLRARGYAPRTIIDAGANVGAFATTVLRLFPQSRVHAIEPQPGCAPALDALRVRSGGRLLVHPCALGGPEEDGAMIRLVARLHSTSSGAHVVHGQPTQPVLEVPTITLDRLLVDQLPADARVLLKLDLQGYELHALRGARAVLPSCEVVLTEASFYAQGYEPPIEQLVAVLATHGFALYDIAAVSARERDNRPRQADLIFVRRDSPLLADTAWS